MDQQMMFRGQREYSTEWVTGSGIVLIGEAYAAITLTKDASPEDYQITLAKVKVATVGKFTGHSDKWGKPIYEGDIIRPDCDEVCYVLVRWNDKDACFQMDAYGRQVYTNEGSSEYESDETCHIEDHYYVFNEHPPVIEVIGNIIDNPELLK